MNWESRILLETKTNSSTRHTAAVAWSGKGKDMWCEMYMGGYYDRNFKIIDVNSKRRKEGWFYSIPCNDQGFINKAAWITCKDKKYSTPKAMDSEIICILGKGIKNYKELPANVLIRTLDKKDLTGYELIPFISTTDVSESVLYFLQYIYPDKELNIDDFQNLLEKIVMKQLPEDMQQILKCDPRTAFTILREIGMLKNSGIFSDEYPKLDIEAVYHTPKIITTFSYDFLLADKEVGVVQSIICKKIKSILIKSANKQPLLFYYRELQDLFNKETEQYYGMVRDAVYYFLTEGRDNMVMVLANFQSFTQVPTSYSTHFQKLYAGGMPLREAENLNNFATIDKITLYKLTTCKAGMGIWISGGSYYYPIEVPPTMHKKKEEGFPVISYLISIYGSQDLSQKNWDNIFKMEISQNIKDIMKID